MMANEQSLPPAYDLIVYGASGFTGRLLVEHLLGTYGARGDIRWALEPFSVRRNITGPGVTLGAQQAQTFALAIHVSRQTRLSTAPCRSRGGSFLFLGSLQTMVRPAGLISIGWKLEDHLSQPNRHDEALVRR